MRPSTLRPNAYLVQDACQNKVFRLGASDMPGVETTVRYQTNSHGFRGPELSPFDRHRILALGCSVAISQYVDQSKTWAALLQRHLQERTGCRIWVGIAARGEINSSDVVTLVHYLMPQYKSAINTVLIWVGVNDLALALSKRDDYTPDYAARMGQEYRIRRAFAHWPGNHLNASSNIRRVVRRQLSCLKHRLIVDKYLQEAAFLESKRLARQKAIHKIDALPGSIRMGLDEYGRNLNRIIDLLQAARVQPIFLGLPSLWTADCTPDFERLLWFGWIGTTDQYYATSVLAHGINLYNQRLLGVCQDRGIKCIDLAALLPKSTDAFYDDVHLNVGGSSLAAQILFDHFAEHPITSWAGWEGNACGSFS